MPMIAVPALVIGGTTVATAAVTSAIVTGIVYGAVIGAATAAISGGNILEGALKGALFGGISGGIVSGLGAAMGAGTSTATSAATGTSGGMASGASAGSAAGGSLGANVGLAGVASAPTSLAAPIVQGGTGAVDVAATTGSVSSPVIPTSLETPITNAGGATSERGFFDKLLFNSEGTLSDGAGKMISEGLSGAAKALMTEDQVKPQNQAEFLADTQRMNVAGKFVASTANIQIPDYWKKYNKVSTQDLSQATNAQPGGAYAQPI